MRKKVLFLLFLIFKCLQIDATAVMPIFSVKHGLYEEPIEISLSADALSKIYYTTDCSEPTLESIPYTKPLRIDRTSILRAISVNSEGEVSDIATCSYIYPKDVVYQTNTPLGYPDHWGDFINIDGVAPADYGMDQVMIQDKNILELVLKGLYSLPIVSLVSEKDNFFGLELDSLKGGIYIYTGVTNSEKALGRGWERPVSFELFNSEYNDDNTTMCGVKLHGGNSRIPESQPKHSFRLHFKSKYGPSKLGYPIFGDEGPSNFDVLVLKSFYNNSWTHLNSLQRSRAQYMRDLWTRCMQLNMGHPSSRGRYCHLFLNGMYWGLYCISERVNSDFCKNLMGGGKKGL